MRAEARRRPPTGEDDLGPPNRLTSQAVATMLNHGKGQLIWNILTEG